MSVGREDKVDHKSVLVFCKPSGSHEVRDLYIIHKKDSNPFTDDHFSSHQSRKHLLDLHRTGVQSEWEAPPRPQASQPTPFLLRDRV